MKCPSCGAALQRARYCNANVHQCNTCKGHLIDQRRVESLKRRVNKNVAELVSEAIESSSTDNEQSVRCPKCRCRMKKGPAKRLNFQIDTCPNCDSIWLDGGELARLQLEFENRIQTRELNSMRERLKSMTPAQRSAYEQRIASLVDNGSMFEQAFGEATCELLTTFRF